MHHHQWEMNEIDLLEEQQSETEKKRNEYLIK
jgi:hypothetical protein